MQLCLTLIQKGLKKELQLLKRKNRTGHFTSRGQNLVHSMDGHDKLMGYQNNTFHIAVYACIDTCSEKIVWVKSGQVTATLN